MDNLGRVASIENIRKTIEDAVCASTFDFTSLKLNAEEAHDLLELYDKCAHASRETFKIGLHVATKGQAQNVVPFIKVRRACKLGYGIYMCPKCGVPKRGHVCPHAIPKKRKQTICSKCGEPKKKHVCRFE